MTACITIEVPGIPKPGGSKKAFVIGGKARITDAGGESTKIWRQDVRNEGQKVMKGIGLIAEPIAVEVSFYMPRPKAHYRTGKFAGQLKTTAPFKHTKKPDATKLWRSTEDALTGIVWTDDSAIYRQTICKYYSSLRRGHFTGAIIKIYVIPEGVSEL